MSQRCHHAEPRTWCSRAEDELGGVPARRLRNVRQLFSDFLARSTLREQVADLERRGGLDEVLTDIGISRPCLERIIRFYPEAGRLRPAMAKRLGVDADKLDPGSQY